MRRAVPRLWILVQVPADDGQQNQEQTRHQVLHVNLDLHRTAFLNATKLH
jgi:hypothetical protein